MTNSIVKKNVTLWPFLIGPAAMILVYAAHFGGMETIVSRRTNEHLALILLSIPLVCFLTQSIVNKKPFFYFMAALTASFFCREWHFAGTSKGIYVALVLLGIWGFMQKVQIFETIGNGRYKIWLFATFATYLLSQLIARRVFRSLCLPMEDQLHILLEETVETTAHVMLLIAGLAALKLKKC